MDVTMEMKRTEYVIERVRDEAIEKSNVLSDGISNQHSMDRATKRPIRAIVMTLAIK